MKIGRAPLRLPTLWDTKFFDRFVRDTFGTMPGIYTGTGVPPSTLGSTGDLYTRKDGGTNTTLYVREGSGWVAK